MGKVSANGLCSKQHILHLLYATLFLLPLNPFLFYITLLPAIGAWLYNWKREKEGLFSSFAPSFLPLYLRTPPFL